MSLQTFTCKAAAAGDQASEGGVAISKVRATEKM
jgi:hypothetical protein